MKQEEKLVEEEPTTSPVEVSVLSAILYRLHFFGLYFLSIRLSNKMA